MWQHPLLSLLPATPHKGFAYGESEGKVVDSGKRANDLQLSGAQVF